MENFKPFTIKEDCRDEETESPKCFLRKNDRSASEPDCIGVMEPIKDAKPTKKREGKEALTCFFTNKAQEKTQAKTLAMKKSTASNANSSFRDFIEAVALVNTAQAMKNNRINPKNRIFFFQTEDKQKNPFLVYL